MTIWINDGEPIEIPIDKAHPKRSAIRWSVGRHGHRAAVWRMWANAKHSDVYVAVRDLAGLQKFSLHESGDFRHQWIASPTTAEMLSSVDRVSLSWSDGPEYEGALTKGMSIYTPAGELRDQSDGGAPTDCVWLPEPPVGFMSAVLVMKARPDQGVINFGGARPFGAFVLADGSVAMACAFQRPITQAEANRIAEMKAKVARVEIPPGVELGVLRMSMHGVDEFGHGFVVDLAGPWPPAGETVGETEVSG